MAAYVVLQDGLWINTAEWDGVTEWPLPEGAVAIPFDDGIYDWDGNLTYDGITYPPPSSL